jgi:carboxylesterase
VRDAIASLMVSPPTPASIIKGAEPFRFDAPGDVACLLVHGFTGTPGEVRDLGQFLSQRRRVFLCGLSMGGTLVLNVAARRSGDPRLAGVISLAAPLRVVDWRLNFLPIIGLVQRWQRWSDPDIKDRSAWERHLGYRAFHLHALRQLLALLRDTRGRVGQVSQPLLVLHSRFDHTVAAFNAELIHRTVASERRKLVWLDNSFHVITLDFDAGQVRDEVLAFIREHA